MASQPITRPCASFSRVSTPSSSSAIAPTARMISGSRGLSVCNWTMALSSVPLLPLLHQSGGGRRHIDGRLVALDKPFHGNGGHVKQRPRGDSRQQRQRHPPAPEGNLAPAPVLERQPAPPYERAPPHAAVEI